MSLALYAHATKLPCRKLDTGRYELTDPSINGHPPRLVATLFLVGSGWAARCGDWATEALPRWDASHWATARNQREFSHRHEAVKAATTAYLEWALATEPHHSERQEQLDQAYLTARDEYDRWTRGTLKAMKYTVDELGRMLKQLQRQLEYAQEAKTTDALQVIVERFDDLAHRGIQQAEPHAAAWQLVRVMGGEQHAAVARAALRPERAQAIDDGIVRDKMVAKLHGPKEG